MAGYVQPIWSPSIILEASRILTITWKGNRSLLLTLLEAMDVHPSDPELTARLLGLVYADATQIIEDAANVLAACHHNCDSLPLCVAS
ncbi:MAG: hypothetical protein HY329_17145, partial [Chloroflexi bacterium]|nr:hypothetical protein [Chloroflexota bacterium]